MKISYLKQIKKRIQKGILQDMLRQTRWIYDYARHYWWAMILYTALGLTGTILGLGSSIVSKNLVDIITGHETGELVRFQYLYQPDYQLCVQLDQYESRCGY